jgi:hypothetical protein
MLLAPLDSSGEPAYGQLVPGAISYQEMSGVQAEICRDHLFDPFANAERLRLPAKYRLISAATLANRDSRIASLVNRDRRYATYAVGMLCFLSVESFVVDGVRAHALSAMPSAFWWARAEGPPDGQRDVRMRGNSDYVQLASWYAREGTDRTRILAADPMAQFVELDMRQTQPGQWHIRMVLPKETVEAEVRLSGQRSKMNRPQPGFSTVPDTGNRAAYFTVFTYFGHYYQAAGGEWHASGSGVFTKAFAISGEGLAFETGVEDGWQSRSGLYKFAR